MYPIQINDHEDQAKNLLLHQFKNSPNILKLVEIYADQIQELEIEYFTLLEALGIETAFGYGLDLIGKEVGEPRQSRSDEVYRKAILVRIFINNANATPEDVISATKQITAATTVNYSEQYPAGVALEIIGVDYIEHAATIKRTLPAGVDLIFNNQLPVDTATVFGGVGYSYKITFESNPLP